MNVAGGKADKQSGDSNLRRSVSRDSGKSSGGSTTGADDDEGFAAEGTKDKQRGRSRKGSDASAAPTEASVNKGWGKFEPGPW